MTAISQLLKKTTEHFEALFGRAPRYVVAAPGRVNLLGEHTDYNDGWVLPMAIERYVLIAADPHEGEDIRWISLEASEAWSGPREGPFSAIKQAWFNYPLGVMAGMTRRGLGLPGFDALISSEVPLGGGLSSSAALEVATATLLETLTQHVLSPLEKARLCQTAEHEFAGVPCGLMDQLASVFGRPGQCLLIDCRSLTVSEVPLLDDTVRILVINSNVRHELGSSEYARRRAECEEAALRLQKTSLRDVTMSHLLAQRDQLSDVLFRRARHVVSENERTLQAAAALRNQNHALFGQTMYESHASLRDDYEVSCHELNVLVEACSSLGVAQGVFGARMTGGGFGGCVVALVQKDAVEPVAHRVAQHYQRETSRIPTWFISRPAQGAQVLARPDVFLAEQHPHRRFNPLKGEWVLVSPHRTLRPWQGQTEPVSAPSRPTFDPQCYLCPGNQRAGQSRNPVYEGTYVFDNDFAALLPDTPQGQVSDGLLQAESVRGVCRVVCFSPRHDLSLAELPVEEIDRVLSEFARHTTQLQETYPWVQAFENKGQMMGCSNPHPHGQIWACSALPNEALTELKQQTEYALKKGSPLLLDYAHQELKQAERVIVSNAHFVVVVPYWAVWPFETLVLPLFEVGALSEFNDLERRALANVLKPLLLGYDRLFNVSFPYSMGWHQRPASSRETTNARWQLHAHFLPPLLRSASVKKFMVGYEMLSETQRDLTPEAAAFRLRSCVES